MAGPSQSPQHALLPVLLLTHGQDAERRSFLHQACLFSFAAHLLVIVILMVIVFQPSDPFSADLVLARMGEVKADQPIWEIQTESLSDAPVDLAVALPDAGLQDNSINPDLSKLNAPMMEAEPVVLNLRAELSQPVPEFSESIGPIQERIGSSPPRRKITAGRTPKMKAELLSKFGGTPQTEAAVRRGLEWLIKQQHKDGGWSFQGPYLDRANFENRVAATSMALLAFLGAGHTHQVGDYQEQVDQALHWLVKRQKPGGNLGNSTPMNHAIYTHAQAAIVLCEAYGMTDDVWLRPHCETSLKFLVRAQSPEGGWRYLAGVDADTSVTGWAVMALYSGYSAGFDVPEATLLNVSGYLDLVSHDRGQSYGYVPRSRPTPSMTAEGLLCRMLISGPIFTPQVLEAKERTALVGQHVSWPAPIQLGATQLAEDFPFRAPMLTYYYWYYTTQVLHFLGGDAWERWNEDMREQLPSIQSRAGKDAGSWPPSDARHEHHGRLYSTCMALYCLEVYYRHLPMYDPMWLELQPELVPQVKE